MANRRRSEGFGFFLPIFGAILIMPPIVQLFDHGGALFGVPTIFAYLFGVWFFLVLFSFVLARLLPRDEPDQHGRAGPFERDHEQ